MEGTTATAERIEIITDLDVAQVDDRYKVAGRIPTISARLEESGTAGHRQMRKYEIDGLVVPVRIQINGDQDPRAVIKEVLTEIIIKRDEDERTPDILHR